MFIEGETLVNTPSTPLSRENLWLKHIRVQEKKRLEQVPFVYAESFINSLSDVDDIDTLPPCALLVRLNKNEGLNKPWSIVARGLINSPDDTKWSKNNAQNPYKILSIDVPTLTSHNWLSTVRELLIERKSWVLNLDQVDTSRVDTEVTLSFSEDDLLLMLV